MRVSLLARANLHPDDRDAARRATLDMLARRDRSSGQILGRLTAKGFSAEVAADVVDILVGENLINDRRYVEHFLAYHANRGQGPVKVRGELRQMGVATELIDEFVDAYPDWLGRARAVRQKKFGARLPSDYAEKARQARFLAHRGFTGAQIRSALDFDEEL